MRYFPQFPRAVQLHVLKCLTLSEQCAFARASTECTRLSVAVTRLREELTIPERASVRAGITALAEGGRLSKLRSVRFEGLKGCADVVIIHALFQNCPHLAHVTVKGWVCTLYRNVTTFCES